MIRELITSLGVLILQGVQVNENTYDIMVDVTEIIRPVVLTSAERRPLKQARIMIVKHHKGVNLFNIYGEKIREALPFIISKDEIGLANFLINNGSFSSHLCGKAVDIRSYSLTKGDIDKLKEGLKDKYTVIYEDNPPHVHIENKDGCK